MLNLLTEFVVYFVVYLLYGPLIPKSLNNLEGQ